jgi:methyltransferase (TIGR00027 family)
MASSPSFTAETMALQRSFESHRPPAQRLFSDPFADAFLRPRLRMLAVASGVPVLRRLVTGVYDAIGGPGPRPSAILRTRVIDDALRDASPALGQCVLLGAGYDTRAHRLAALAGMQVFEVDRPVTQQAKRAIVDRLGLTSDHVTYVAIDFERDDLSSRLVAAGFDRTVPTTFLWEGVTQYLTGAAVDSTLSAVRGLAGGGGVLIMTYVDVRALGAASPFPEARRWVRAVARAGEPWTFGLLPGDVPAFFADRGFVLVRDLSTLDAGRQLSRSERPRLAGSALYRVTVAEIAGAARLP